METRGLLQYNHQQASLKMDLQNSEQQYGQAFLCNLLLPFIESYWLTLTYFISLENKKAQHDEEAVFSKIQWLAETLHD